MAHRKGDDSTYKLLDALPGIIILFLFVLWSQTGNLSLVLSIYVAILIAIIGLGHFVYRRKRKKLFESGIEQIDAMSGIMFERLLLEYFKAIGYKGNLIAEKADYGADLVLKKDSIKYVVLAKRWNG